MSFKKLNFYKSLTNGNAEISTISIFAQLLFEY